jgi:thiamine-phosphate pyrophosphorylase
MMKLKGLYGITDGSTGTELINKVTQAIQGGLTVLQYRSKSSDYQQRLDEALSLRELCCKHRIPFIINDDIKLAKLLHADGVHIGQHDGSIQEARQLLGNHAIIGVSCYNRLELALEAQQQGANYIAFGAFFNSPTKPHAPAASINTLQTAKQKIHIPICSIGGITLDNASQLIDNGSDMVAVISSLFSANNINSTAKQFSQLFKQPAVILH